MSQNRINSTGRLNTLSILGRALAKTFRKMWFMFIFMGLTAFAAMGLAIIPPLILKNVVDNYLNTHNLNGIWLVAAAYLAASLGSSVLGFIQVFINSYIGQNILLELR